MRKIYTLICCLLFLLQFSGNTQVVDSIQLYNDYITTSGGIPISFNVLINDVNLTNEEIVITGPKLQWKQLLGVGVVIDLDSLIQTETD